MKNYFISLLCAVLLPAIVKCQQSNDFASAMQMLQLVNNARLQQNIRPLCLSDKLVRSATAQSAYQASINTMTHDGPVSLGDRFVRQGYQPAAVAENVGFTSTPFIQVVFDIWMSSPEHRANILDPNYVHFGAASSHGSNNMYFWTQLFAKPMSLTAEPCDFSAAATAAALTPGQPGFNPNGSWGGSSNYNAYTPGMQPAGKCVTVDDGLGGKSLSCKVGGADANGPAGPNAIPYTSPGSNGWGPNQYNNNWGSNACNNMGPNSYNPALSPNPMTSAAGPNVINNPPGYTGSSCSVVSTSPAPDGQGSVRVLRCTPGAPGAPGVNNIPGVQPVDGANTMIVNPEGPVGGVNPPGYNGAGVNPVGYNPPGFNPNAGNPPGYNPPGYNGAGINPVGYNPPGYNPIAGNPPGYNAPGYNPPGYNGAGVNPVGAPGFNNSPAAAPANGVYSPFWN